MKILILDDEQSRHDSFSKNFKHHELTHVYHVKDAIKYLSSRIYDAVFLDHDLGGMSDVPSGGKEPTGYDVAIWLSQNPEHCPSEIYIHSMNPVGAQNMRKVLPKAKLAPALWTMTQVRSEE